MTTKSTRKWKKRISPKLFVVLPVYNDWNSLDRLVSEILSIDTDYEFHFIVVDDCSSDQEIDIQSKIRVRCENAGKRIEILKIAINRGNQFAIWVGLNYLHKRLSISDLILVMDSDGEDDPIGIPKLLAAHSAGIPTVAKRGNRANSISFKVWHFSYKRIFKFFTGKDIDFGNFSIIDGLILEKILGDEKSNYLGYVGGLLSASRNICRVQIDKSPRYHGESRTNVHRLVQWGLLQVSPFTDAIFSQALKLSIKFTGICLSASSFFLILRVFKISVIPGWTSLFVSLALAISFILMVITAMFLTLFFLLNAIRVELKLNEPVDPQYSDKVKKFLDWNENDD
jgi:glycosyltransferase involved in cell wall biosynthesis